MLLFSSIMRRSLRGYTVVTVVKGFLFDLDGTLVNTHEANFHAYKEAIESVVGATPIDQDELKRCIVSGESSRHFLPKLVEGLTDDQIDTINSHKKTIYPNYLECSTLNTFLVTFLNGITTSHTTVLVTTAKRDNATAVLRHHGIETLFDLMIFGDDVKEMKPHPEAYMKALELTGLRSDEVIAFEDSAKGIESASMAGIQTVEIKEFVQ